MDKKYLLSALDIWTINHNLAIEASRSSQSIIQDVHSVGTGEDHDACGWIETVHFYKELIQSILSLIVATREPTSTTLATDGINLINEDDAGCIRSGLLEQIADTRWTDADKHFNEIGT
jgi:hypothetical protein